ELTYQFFNFFEHGNIKLSKNLEMQLEKVFITPALHRKHHSQVPNELNSNYGTIFSFWDKFGRTKTPSHSEEKFALGLPKQDHDWSLKEVLLKPFGF
ncbi:MAG: sterol desaturase family protein, partial [Bdellovibrionales bacterium]|nr:sterol desaturase family protein [Bdellovibrionales bacterium]